MNPAEIPSVLLPYQARSIQLADTVSLFTEEKCRRSGLTYGFAARAVMKAAPAVRPVNTFYIAYNKDMTREFITYCGDFARFFDTVSTASSEFLFDDGSEKGILALRVDFPSGKSIVALSSKPRSLRGMQGDVIIDEAAFHDDFEGVLKAALALTMWGGRVAVISTHNGADNPFNTLIQDIRSKKRRGLVERLTLEEALADGLYKRICLVSGQEWSSEAEAEWEAELRGSYGDGAAEELDVIPARGGGVYLARATIEACQQERYKVERFTPPDDFESRDRLWQERYVDEWLKDTVLPLIRQLFDPHRRSFFGQDFARSSDLSVIALGQIDPSSVLCNPLTIELRNTPFRSQFRILSYLVKALPMWSTGKMDARGNGQQLAEDMRQDFGSERIESVMATQETYLTRMPRMKARFEDRTIIIPQHDGCLEDLRLIKLVKGVPSVIDRVNDKEDGAKGKRHGDYAIALMNLVGAADEDVQPIDLHTLGTERAMGGEFVLTDTGFGTVTHRDSFGDRGGW